jgi:hypothetical protein
VNYGVTINPTTGAWTGYGWSSNIGWINFGSTSCGARPTMNMTTGAVTGWAEIMSPSQKPSDAGGWTGCVSMSGIAQNGASYGVVVNPATGAGSGYAWNGNDVGRDVMSSEGIFDGIIDVGSSLDGRADIGAGWIDFSGISAEIAIPSATASVTLDTTPVFSGSCGSTANVTWAYDNVITTKAGGNDCDMFVNGIHDEYVNIDVDTSIPYTVNSAMNFRLECEHADEPGTIVSDTLSLSCTTATQCNDGIDNDADRTRDAADASCHTDCNIMNLGSYDASINNEARTCIGDSWDDTVGGGTGTTPPIYEER